MTTNWVEDVRAFHVATDTPVLDSPTMPSSERVTLRWSLIDEEVNRELIPTMLAYRNIEEIADAIADSIYVLIGTALEYGIPLDRVWDEVQISNMAKIDPLTGKVRKRQDGKVMKPDGWQPPDINTALYG